MRKESVDSPARTRDEIRTVEHAVSVVINPVNVHRTAASIDEVDWRLRRVVDGSSRVVDRRRIERRKSDSNGLRRRLGLTAISNVLHLQTLVAGVGHGGVNSNFVSLAIRIKALDCR